MPVAQPNLSLRARIAAVLAILTLMNVGAWGWALLAWRRSALLLGTALVAYSLGLRHGADADHIAAIDNATRNLVQRGQRPAAVGLMFSLGHAAVVALGAVAISGSALWLQPHASGLRQAIDSVGVLISALLLFAIALANVAALRSILAALALARAGAPPGPDLAATAPGGLMTRWLRPLFNKVGRTRHMFALGALFGLGFDTATEIGVLALSAAAAAAGVSLPATLSLAALFAAGMALVDSLDNLLMLGAYGWAFASPVRKLYYNLAVTALSVLAAAGVGGLELLGLAAGPGRFWTLIGMLNRHMTAVGAALIAMFVLVWGTAVAIHRTGAAVSPAAGSHPGSSADYLG